LRPAGVDLRDPVLSTLLVMVFLLLDTTKHTMPPQASGGHLLSVEA
jgi:hypothetical protein